MNLAEAAPLACAGITTYSPLVHYGAKAAGEKGEKFNVGIVGLGGLGAMGAKISKAMGNNVVVFSTSERKREYVEKELGIENFVVSKDKEQMKNWKDKIDLMICTISADFDVHPYLTTLKPQSTFCMVGVPPNDFTVEPFAFVARRIKIGGSLIGGIKETQEMVDFCSKHGIVSDIELISPVEVNNAWQSVSKNVNSKTRFVIDWKGFEESGEIMKEDWEVCTPVEVYEHKIHPKATILGAPSVAEMAERREKGAAAGVGAETKRFVAGA
jgi:alcohol dehydrogenase (NADP+)